jgi:TonB family protein
MKEFISRNIKYPSRAMELGIQGKVYIRMTIDKEGQVKDPTVIRGIDPECDQEALNTVLKFPKFVPAQVNGENVNSLFTLPIIFKLDGDIENRRDIKKHFEKTYSDSTIHKAGANYISSYVFSTNRLGWINCDRFINVKGERTDLWVALEKNEDSDVKIVFHRMRAILPSKSVNGNHLFNRIPKGEKITIVAIKKIDNIPYLAFKETFTSEQTVSDFTFKPVTMESLKFEMRKLDGLHK